MKIYLSGKIGGLPESDVYHNFSNAAIDTIAIDASAEIISPIELPHAHDKSWSSYMLEDLKALSECDAIYMLRNWTDSPGARIEHDFAVKMAIPIYYQKPKRIAREALGE